MSDVTQILSQIERGKRITSSLSQLNFPVGQDLPWHGFRPSLFCQDRSWPTELPENQVAMQY